MQKKSDTKLLGIGMLIIAMVIGLGLLTQLFQNILDKQYNPNQSIQTSHINQNFIEISLKQNRLGHYVGTGEINRKKIVFLLDTGATSVAIPEYQAQELGLKKGRKISISTANGRSIGYLTTIGSLSLGEIHLYNINAIITPNLDEILLGMSVLKQLEFSQRGTILTLKQPL
ncbi:MAG: TIGR02281 family clan AA aspartic protease [Gammaproteobacteria bacterium]|nr:TIGR02281 family clan AA aspartic protease [Gammaproteobacteria bacterium]